MSCRFFHHGLLVFALLTVGAGRMSLAQGLVYQDADDGFFGGGNLSTVSGAPLSDALDSIAFANDDDKWGTREFSTDGVALQSWPTEDAPELIQTLSGLTPGSSYDIYAVFWTANSEYWGVRAGLSSGPTTNPYFSFGSATIGSTTTVTGTPSIMAHWESLPPDNGNANDGLQGIFAEGNRDMRMGLVGTAVASGAGEVDVFIDDLVAPGGGSVRTWYDGLAYVQAGTDVLMQPIVDRATGSISFVNNTQSDWEITGYTIESAAGGLNETAWQSISDGSNTGVSDTDVWSVANQSATMIGESEDPSAIEQGALIENAGLPLGSIWNPSPFEDILITASFVDLTNEDPALDGVTTLTMAPIYVGDPLLLGDFDASGAVDTDDYLVMMSNMHSPLGVDTAYAGYAMGDINGDLAVNFNDFRAFKTAYDAANGANAFAAMVPEPSAGVLLGFSGLVFLFVFRRRRQLAITLLIGMLGVGLCHTSSVAAQQITYIDADEEPGGNTAGLPGGWVTRGAGSSASNDTANFANGGAALQANGLDGISEISTTFNGLDASSVYDVFAFFWDTEPVLGWHIEAGLESGNLSHFNYASPGVFKVDATTDITGLNVLGQTPDDYSDFVDGNRALYGAFVGRVDGTDSATVYVNRDGTASGERSWYDGVGYALTPDLMTLEVNTTTGLTTIKNSTVTEFDLDYYEITSASGALDPAGWTSIDSTEGNDPFGQGWDEAGGSSANILSEGNLTSSMLFVNGATQALGNAFTSGAAEDLRFAYSLGGDDLEVGLVRYVSGGITGDFDDDGDYACADIDALTAAIIAGNHDAAFDLTGEGEVTLADMDAWLIEAGAAENASGNAYYKGDLELGGSVGSADLGIMLNNWSQSGKLYCGGDLNADSLVGSGDLGILLNNFGAVSAAASAAAVPEPGGLPVVSLLVLLGVAMRSRRSRRLCEDRIA